MGRFGVLQEDFAALGLDPRIVLTRSLLKQAYKKTAARWHPDHNLGNERSATERFIAAQRAFERLLGALDSGWDGAQASLLFGLGRDGGGQGTTGVRASATGSGDSRFGRGPESPFPGGAGARERVYTGPGSPFWEWLNAARRAGAKSRQQDQEVVSLRSDPRGAAALLVITILLGATAFFLLWRSSEMPASSFEYKFGSLLSYLLMAVAFVGEAFTFLAVIAAKVGHYELSNRHLAAEVWLFERRLWRRQVAHANIRSVKLYHFLVWAVVVIDSVPSGAAARWAPRALTLLPLLRIKDGLLVAEAVRSFQRFGRRP